jgi:hypothetical protein
LEDVSAIYGMADHLGDGGADRVRWAAVIELEGFFILQELLSYVAPRPEDLARLKIRDRSYIEAFQKGLELDNMTLDWMLIRFTCPDPGDKSWVANRTAFFHNWFLTSPFYRTFFLPRDLAAYRREINAMQDVAQLPYAKAQARWKNYVQTIPDNKGVVFRLSLLTGSSDMGWHVFEDLTEADARRRLARLALAVETYRAMNGKFPDRLDDLTPEYIASFPVDPFDGKPLRLKHVGNDLLLYSVNRDGIDDGGITYDKATRQSDLIFRLKGR